MKKRLLLHIGIGKTGTTSIQDMLLNNQARLAEHGVLYPKTGIVQFGHHGLAILDEQTFSAKTHALYQGLLKEIRNSSCHTVLISSENYSFMTAGYINDLANSLQEFEVKIVFYVREQIKLFASSYLEWLKVGKEHQGSVKKFFELHKNSFDFARRIAPWEDAFGQENIMVRLFEKRIVGEDVCNDFLAFLGFEFALKLPKEQANPSLAEECVDLVHYLDGLDLEAEQRRQIITYLLDISQHLKQARGKPLFEPEYKEYIYEFYQRSNLLFANRYLKGDEKELLIARPQ